MLGDWIPWQLLVSLVLAVAVYFDALSFGRRHGWRRGFPSLGPIMSAVLVFIFPVISGPIYMYLRIRLTRSAAAREAAVRERQGQVALHEERDRRTSMASSGE